MSENEILATIIVVLAAIIVVLITVFVIKVVIPMANQLSPNTKPIESVTLTSAQLEMLPDRVT
jgi:hypothetical protein